MKRTMRILTIAALSSVYVMQGACTLGTGDGISIIPTVTDIFANIPILGDFISALRS